MPAPIKSPTAMNGQRPLALGDSQMAELMMRAKMLKRFLRAPYLEAVAAELRGKTIGDATVHRACIDAARKVEVEATRSKRSAPACALHALVPR
jgi:hypothetical protein